MIAKPRFYVIKLKRNLLSILFLVFTFCLLIFSKSNLPAVKSGLLLWANSIVPSLFPFFVATELLMHTNIVAILENALNRYMKPVFNIGGQGSFAFIMGIISGYPIGAKIATNFRKNNICSKEECERLLSFTNNSSCLFIVGTVGILMFQNITIGFLLLITHLLACITVGFLFRFWKKDKNTFTSDSTAAFNHTKKSVSFSNLGEILSESITSSISTILLIGGFVIIFSSIISIFKASGIFQNLSILLSPIFQFLNIDTCFIEGILTGLLEITNGIDIISSISCKKLSLNIIFTSFLLGFGGLSVLLQVWSIISKTDLSIKPYLYGKLLQGLFSAIYTYFLMNIFPFFYFDL